MSPAAPYPSTRKNEIFKRPFWDPSLAQLRHDFYEKASRPKKTPGYRLEDQAAVMASWYLDEISGPDQKGRATGALPLGLGRHNSTSRGCRPAFGSKTVHRPQ